MSAQLASSIASLVRIEAASAGAIDAVVPLGHHAMDHVVALGQSIYVRGWAVDVRAAALASRVVLVVDGVLEFPATYGQSRADIANAFGVAEYARAGFEAVLPPVLGLGTHNVAACAVTKDGTSFVSVATAEFHVIPSLVPRPFFHAPTERGKGEIITCATDGDLRTPMQRAGRLELAFDGGVTISGWAESPGRAFAEMGIVVDDRWFVEARALPSRTYEARFVLNFALPGGHELYAAARTANGAYLRVSETLNFESIEPTLPWIWALVELQQPTSASIDEIEVTGGTLAALPRGSGIFLRGTAIDEPAGSAAGGVYISIDGDRLAPIAARYGRPVPGKTHHTGFTALVPTGSLSAGTHTLELLVAANAWSGYYVPLPPLRFTIVP